jgi:acyl-CoA hydrolase
MKRLIDSFEPGQRVWVPTLSNESALLGEELLAEPERARDVTFMGVQFPGIDKFDYLTLHPQARQVAWFMSPAVRRGLTNGRVELLTQDYLGIVRHLSEQPPVDVAIAQLTPPDADGWCSPGLACDFVPLVWGRARRRVAHLNPRLPRIASGFRVHVSELDHAAENDAPLIDFAEPAAGVVEQQIGAHVAALVRDGDTLQFGIGSVPLALASALSSHRKLRFRAGIASGALRTLWQSGALERDAPALTGAVLGDAAFRDFAAEMPTLRLVDVTQTHDVQAIANTPRFIAINSAVEVDLFGQINAERAGGAVQAGAGGLPAFAAGALASRGGRLLICLPATARRGSVSRIVPTLNEDAMCTLPRWMADAVVTEHGVAELRGLALDARADALIAIAAPEHRASLAQAWDDIRRRA